MSDDAGKSSYRLVRGTFSADDANEILMTLIEDKISFHQRNNWSRGERFGESTEAGVTRIAELRQTKADLAALIEEARAGGMKLDIRCDIDITLAPEG